MEKYIWNSKHILYVQHSKMCEQNYVKYVKLFAFI